MARHDIRIITRAVCFIVFSAIMISNAFAGAYEFGGLGMRALSMGGAFIGLADDWTAIYWNPAGLAQQQSNGWGCDFLVPSVTIADGNSMSNLTVGVLDTQFQIDVFIDYAGVEPRRFNNTESKNTFYHPQGLGGFWRKGDVVIGTGFYTPIGYSVDWKDTLSYGAGTISAELSRRLYLLLYNVSLAKEVSSNLSLGVGANLVYGQINSEASKIVNNSGILDYTFNQEFDSDGLGAEATFGALFHASETLSFGAVYRTGSTLRLRGQQTVSLTLTGLAEESDLKQKFPYPATYGFGIAFKATEKLTATADLQRTNWSVFKTEVDYDNEALALQDKDYSVQWKDSNRYRCGMEYSMSEQLALRCGYFFDESPIPDKSISLSHIVDVNRHGISCGAGYAFGDTVTVDLVYGYAWGMRNINSVKYYQKAHAVGFTVSRMF